MYIKSLSLSFYLLFHSWVRARRVEDEVVLKRPRRTETLSGVGVGVGVRVFSCIFRTSSLSLFLSFTRGFTRAEDDAHIPNSQDIRFRERISNTRGDHFGQH